MTKPARYQQIDAVQSAGAPAMIHPSPEARKVEFYDAAQIKQAKISTPGAGPAREDMFRGFAGIAPVVSPVGVYAFRDFELHGLAFLFKDGEIVDQPDLIPAYVRHDVDRGHQPHLNAGLPLRAVEGLSVIFVSNAYRVYGHWLIDILPRLWMFQRFVANAEEATVVIPTETPEFALKILSDFFGVRGHASHALDHENLLLERALVPSLLHNDHYFHPAMNDFVDDMLRHHLVVEARRAPLRRSERIFISRKNYREVSTSYARTISNEDEVLALMEEQGFQIVCPEAHSWQDQIAMFSAAKIIAGEDGSALHNAIFAAKGTAVICLNPANQVQISIAALREQTITVQCPDTDAGTFGGSNPVDMDRLRAAVEAAVATTGAARSDTAPQVEPYPLTVRTEYRPVRG